MAIIESLSSSMASSSSTPEWTYDVFLSFRGEDTRKAFTGHLYDALWREGISTFRDDEELERGKSISPNLLRAIEQSRTAVVVLSKHYADSTWCLNELVRIVECMKEMGQIVLPVFYDVDPSEVRKQTGSFSGAFAAHEQHLSHVQVQTWRATLTETANLKGFHFKDRNESTFIQEIVEDIISIVHRELQSDSTGLVGIGSRVEEIMKLCSGIKKNNDVGFIGICGMGGIGKTTLAQCFVDNISNQFHCVSFLHNVREVSAGRDGLATLQEQLLFHCGMKIGTKMEDVRKRIKDIKHRLGHKKVLLVLDDVDKLEQLEALSGSHTWFGRGSRIIITTRDEHLLIAPGVDEIYKVKRLNDDEALDLFNCKAFKNGNHDTERYKELSYKFVRHAKGLPLAIVVLGGFLCGRSLTEWESAYAREKKKRYDLEDDIMKVLVIGFNGLNEEEKQIFLDIACFFKGKDQDHTTMVLESFGFDAVIGVRVLIEKSLITIVQGKLWMHDLLQNMGWKIVRQESIELGNRSRLWHWEDALHVLQYNEGTTVVQGIVLNLPEGKKVLLNCDAFTKMKKLRFLKVSDVLLPRGLSYLSTELQVIDWHGYSSTSLPSNFPSDKLVLLNMCSSKIRYLWKGFKALDMLKSIELNDSASMIETPDFSGVPNLERLVLKGCTSLHKVHPSISTLKKLILLDMENCKSFESLPSPFSLESLQVLILSGCARLKKFPEIVGDMGRLLELYLERTALEELPLSIQHLTGLTLLDMTECKNLLRISSAISSLNSLKNVTLSGCSNLEDIPEQIGGVESLEELDISGTAIRQVPSSIVHLTKLKLLSCSGCKGPQWSEWTSFIKLKFIAAPPIMGLLLPSSFSGLISLTNLNLSFCNLLDEAIPDDMDSLSSLRNLNLMGNHFTSLPEKICRLSNLTELHVIDCSRLQTLPELPNSIIQVSADGCSSLKSDSDQYEVWNSWHALEEQKIHIVKRLGSQMYGVVMSALSFVTWLQRYDEDVINQPLRTTHGFSAGANTVPQWFDHQSDSSTVVTSLLRSELDPAESISWMGYALYICCDVVETLDNTSSRSFKVKHTFDCHFDTDDDEKQTLEYELDVIAPFTGPNGYWLYIRDAWFLQRLGALNECKKIKACTKTESPAVELKFSGSRLLLREQDFTGFIQAITSNCWRPLPSTYSDTSGTHLPKWTEEYQGCNIPSTVVKQLLQSLPLQCYESLLMFGGKSYIIEGNLNYHPRVASTFEKILQEYSGVHIFYTNCFPECKFPEWFSRDVSASDFKKTWKGIAVCIAYTVHGTRTLALRNLDMKYSLRSHTGLCDEKIHHVNESTIEQLMQLKRHDFIWISFTSRGSFPNYTLKDSMELDCHEITPDLRVHKSGLQPVFSDDMEGFMEAIMQCSSTSP